MEWIILHGLAVFYVRVCALRGVVLLVGVSGSGLQPFCGLLLSVTGKAEGPLGVSLECVFRVISCSEMLCVCEYR
jgi:hypothetical protein